MNPTFPLALGVLVFLLGCGSTKSSPDGGSNWGSAPLGCAPLDPPAGAVLEVGPGDDLAEALRSAPAGATVLLADGTYQVGADGLWFGADDVTLRGANGNREAVVLDGNYAQSSGGVVNVWGHSGNTIAHLTIRRSRYHTVHITGGPSGKSDAVRLYDLHLLDPGEQAVKINASDGNDCDNGEIACSLIELSDAGRERVMGYEASGMHCYTGGIDVHRGRGWMVRDNVVRGFWCSNGDLSEHGIHFWEGARDTLVERNLLIDNARGIGFGLGTPSAPRIYDDHPCGGAAVDHYGGIIRNNMVVGTRPELFASPNGMDVGIGLWSACEAVVVHNTVASTAAPFSSIEWRFAETSARVVNNLATHPMQARDGARADLQGNVEDAPASSFVDLAGGNAHLAAGASMAIGKGVDEGATLAPTDFDGDSRSTAPDVGADQRIP